jgi:hypothetical protein
MYGTMGHSTIVYASCKPYSNVILSKDILWESYKKIKFLTFFLNGFWDTAHSNQWCGSGSGSAGSDRFMVEAEAEAPKNKPPPLPVCFKVDVQILVDACWLEIFCLQFLLNIHLNSSKFFLFTENNAVKYYLTNCKTNLQIENHNLKQIWKRKRFRKRLLSAGSGSAGSGSG